MTGQVLGILLPMKPSARARMAVHHDPEAMSRQPSLSGSRRELERSKDSGVWAERTAESKLIT